MQRIIYLPDNVSFPNNFISQHPRSYTKKFLFTSPNIYPLFRQLGISKQFHCSAFTELSEEFLFTTPKNYPLSRQLVIYKPFFSVPAAVGSLNWFGRLINEMSLFVVAVLSQCIVNASAPINRVGEERQFFLLFLLHFACSYRDQFYPVEFERCCTKLGMQISSI